MLTLQLALTGIYRIMLRKKMHYQLVILEYLDPE